MAEKKTTKKPKVKQPQQISPEEFRKKARALAVKIGNNEIAVMPKEFSSGSLGWYTNEKVSVSVGDTLVKVQAILNIIIVGSKAGADKSSEENGEE